MAGAALALGAAAALAAGGYLLGSAGEADPPPAPVASPHPAASATQDLNAELRRLDGRLVTGRRRLASARTRRGQARAAASLAAEYRRGAGAVGAIAPAPGLDSGGLSPRLRTAATAYASLARAARKGDRRGYAVARRRARAAEAALRSSLANL